MTARVAVVEDLIDAGGLVVGDGYRAKNVELGEPGTPFLRVANLNSGFLVDEAECLAEENVPRAGHKLSESGDVVFTGKGTVGRFGFVRDDTPSFVYSPQLCFWRVLDRSLIEPQWLYYWMHGSEFQHQLASVSAQTDMAAYVSLRDQRHFRITVPPLSEQQRVAQTLGALDDKIELNRRMNRTLESIVRAIFKSWFVDFDPVRKKMEGGEVALPPDFGALFPDAFEPSVVGPVPRGWSVSEIGKEIEAVGGSTPSTGNEDYWDGPIAFATPKDLSGVSAPVLLNTDRAITAAGAAVISSGVLDPGTVLMSSRAPIGYLALSEIPVCVNQGFIAMKCVYALSSHYVMHWARANMDSIVGNANGTTFLEISKRNFRPLPVVVPPQPLVERFTAFAESLHRQVLRSLREVDTLTRLRDAVLPRLLSGELRVQDAGGADRFFASVP